MSQLEIIQAKSDRHLRAVRALFLEYAASLGFDLCFQGFEHEFAELPGCYAPIGLLGPDLPAKGPSGPVEPIGGRGRPKERPPRSSLWRLPGGP